MTPPTLSDVARAYRLFLGREVESATVAGLHIAASPTLWALIERIWASPEAVRRRLGEAAALMSAQEEDDAIDLAATPKQLDRMFAETEREWARRGFGSHHQWLLRDRPRYDARSVRWNLARALEDGRREAEALRRLVTRTGVDLDAADVAVMGEDAYRLAGAVSQGAYLAVPPASEEDWKASLADHGVGEVQSIAMARFRSCAARYDLFYSVMALQYAPPPMALALLDHALERVRPGGLVYFQLACRLHGYRFDSNAYLDASDRDPHGEIHALPQHHVLALLDRRGFAPIEVKPDGSLGAIGVSYTFFARKRR